MPKLDLPTIEKKWQKRWEKANLYLVKDTLAGKENFYHLVMFPYPSGDLHIGHWYNFAPADTYARLKRMQGFNVLSPIGFDAFGLPAENAAIKRSIHPADWTFQNIETMREQLKSMGPVYDWSRQVIACSPDYYTWTQWMFLQMFKAGLAQKRKTWANWCPTDKTVLANEQVVDGKCERCGAEVVQREIDQWVFNITTYAQRLLDDLDMVDWPERTKTMQRNWIGRSEGALIKFQVTSDKRQEIEVFTTRPDTIFGATYLVVAPEHPLLKNQKLGIVNYEEVQEYIKQALKKTSLQRQAEQKQKTGVELKGIKAINPANKQEIPIWVADYVLGEYGTGAIMAVPAHDERDFEFAQSSNLQVICVIDPNPSTIGVLYPSDKSLSDAQEKIKETIELIHQGRMFYTGPGILMNSGQFGGMKSEEAIPLMAKEFGERKVQYKLRDWIVSRQRYWGAPIPMVQCEKCGLVPVPEKDLPVLLPELKDFRPADDGRSPLAKVQEFVNTPCPQCKGPATRETDTMDTFVDSSWYYFRYTDPRNEKAFADRKKLETWLPVDIYIGGAEHTVLHLLYSRFFTKVLYDLKYINFSEPFTRLRHQGIILGPDGQKMSKSRGNVIDPDPLVAEYGSDTVRMFLEFLGPYDQGGPWSPEAINGIARFLEKTARIVTKAGKKTGKADEATTHLLHQTIKKVSEDLEELHFNTAISALMVLVNHLQHGSYDKTTHETLVKLLAPFAPHLAEELWAKLGHKTSVHTEAFPTFDPTLIQEDTVTMIIQVNGKLRGKLELPTGLSQEDTTLKAKADSNIAQWLKSEPKKVIFVPNKLINFVV